MTDYQLQADGSILREADGAVIPADPGNRDYVTYLDWLAAGNTPDPVAVPDPRPAILQAILDFRDLRTLGGYSVQLHIGLKWLQSDVFSRIQEMGLARLGDKQLAAGGLLTDALLDQKSGTQTFWKTMDGSFAPLTVADVENIFAAAGASDTANYTRAEVLRQTVLAVPDPTVIDITAGWPPIYGE